MIKEIFKPITNLTNAIERLNRTIDIFSNVKINIDKTKWTPIPSVRLIGHALDYRSLSASPETREICLGFFFPEALQGEHEFKWRPDFPVKVKLECKNCCITKLQCGTISYYDTLIWPGDKIEMPTIDISGSLSFTVVGSYQSGV